MVGDIMNYGQGHNELWLGHCESWVEILWIVGGDIVNYGWGRYELWLPVIHREKQERLERIREKLTAQMQQKQDDEDERLARAVAEADAKRVREEADKELKMRKAFAEMAEHRHYQVMNSL